jgi:hypothetical protein
MALWSSLTGGVVGVGVGEAMGTALEPALEPQRQAAWMEKTPRVFDIDVVADMVAQGLVSEQAARDEAHRTGFSTDRLDRAIQWRLRAASVEQALTLWRRSAYDGRDPAAMQALFEHAMAKAGIENQWWAHLEDLKGAVLTPAEIAMAIQQGHLPNDNILPVIEPGIPYPAGYTQAPSPDGAPPSTVPLTQINLPTVEAAAAAGLSVEQLQVLANLAGLPPGPHDLLAMWNRNEIDEDAVDAGIREGHMKTKWAHSFKRMRWAVLTAPEYAELHLRDWIDVTTMYQGGALTGHTPDQMDLLYKNRGRTATPRQMALAVVRQVEAPNYPDNPANGRLADETDFLKAVARSNIRTEYGPLLWATRFTYPSLFQLNRLVSAGAITGDTAASWAEKNLEAPEVVAALKAYWDSLSPGTSADPHLAKADSQTWAALHKAYIGSVVDAATVTQGFTLLGITPTAQTEILARWDYERDLDRKRLTPAQVKKALAEGVINQATLAAWTRDEALAYLIELGYSPGDADTFLAI